MRLALALALLLGPAAALAQETPVPDAPPRTVGALSLYADVKARAVGDPLTVILAERTSARRQSQFEDRSQASGGGSAEVAGGGLAGRFGADATVRQQTSAQSQGAQSDLLTGTVTVRVTEVLPGGVLRVEGERRLHVNGANHLLRVRGLVRAADVRTDNTVLSWQLADAEVEYRQDGLLRRRLGPGGLARVGAALLLIAAVVLGASS